MHIVIISDTILLSENGQKENTAMLNQAGLVMVY